MITIDHSAYRLPPDVGAYGMVTDGGGNVSTALKFVDAAHGNFREAAGSSSRS